MSKKQSGTIASDEMQDFWRECTAAGYKPDQFMLSAVEEYPVNPGPIKRIVSVERTNVSPRICYEYDGSSGQDWIAPASAEIRAGRFGPP